MKIYYAQSDIPACIAELDTGSIAFTTISEWQEESLEYLYELFESAVNKGEESSEEQWTLKEYKKRYSNDIVEFIGEVDTVDEAIRLIKTYLLIVHGG